MFAAESRIGVMAGSVSVVSIVAAGLFSAGSVVAVAVLSVIMMLSFVHHLAFGMIF